MRTRLGIGLAAATAFLAWAGRADAHDLRCEKTVNGKAVVTVDHYPAEVLYSIKVWNANPITASTALSVVDALLTPLGFHFSPTPPFTLGVNESATTEFPLTIQSYEECQRLATGEGVLSSKTYLDNVVTVTWNEGSGQCAARVECRPTPCTDCQPGGATRTMGFFKTHETALQACLDQGSVDLGYVTISSLEDALGLLWGSPVRFADKTKRNTLDKARFLLARQTLVGICNQRLFGTAPSPATLLSDAVAALAGTSCADIKALASQVDDFNNSGDSVAFPSGFDPGPATPQDAQDKAQDPTEPSGENCSN